MKIFGFLNKDKRKKRISDYYQESLAKYGKDQLKKLADKGLSIPVVVL